MFVRGPGAVPSSVKASRASPTDSDSLLVTLWMRAAKDTRGDDVVKAELFDAHIRRRFHVRVVLDDRDRVVALWRRLGLPCWQVDYGDF